MNDGWDLGLATYTSVEVFYAEVPDDVRRRSGESDFGCWWWDGPQGYSDQWRVSAVENTGEIYALMERPHMRGSEARLIVLGVLGGPDPGYAKSYACLDGWEHVCGQADSLQWVVDRVKLAAATILTAKAPLVVEPRAVDAGQIRVLYDAWQAETEVVGSAATEAFEALEEVIFESLPPLLTDAAALDAIAAQLMRPDWSGADDLEEIARIVRTTGRTVA